MEIFKAFKEPFVLLTDMERIPKALERRLENLQIKTESHEVLPLKHEHRRAYLGKQLRSVDGLEETIDQFRWLLGGFDPHQLNCLASEVRYRLFRDSTAALGEVLHAAIETTANANPGQQYLQMMSRGLASWDDFCGYPGIREKLQCSLYGPLKDPERFREYGISIPSGVLLWGPSGCGKSLVIQALANDGVFNVLEVRLEEMMSRYFGESEERLRDCFRIARQSAPCLLFIDGVDTVGKRRGLGSSSLEDTTGVGERLLSTMLNEMDGVTDLKGVIVIGTTEDPERMDSALVRPGRFDIFLELGLPTNEDRLDIAKHWAQRLKVTPALDTAHLDSLVVASEGWSAADLVQLFQEAGRLAIRRDPTDPVVRPDDILAMLADDEE